MSPHGVPKDMNYAHNTELCGAHLNGDAASPQFNGGLHEARILVEVTVVSDWQPKGYQNYK